MDAEKIFKKMEAKIHAECLRLGERIPYIAENGTYSDMRDVKLSWWTNGFWPGILWQMYQCTGDSAYKTAAEHTEQEFDKILEHFEALHHDVGFLFLHTAVDDYRLTGNPKSRTRGLHAANILAGRFNPAGNYIRAWNEDKTGWMIVDCLMNVPLLYWAGRELKDPRFEEIARRHTDTAVKYLQRPDGSCNHIAVFDPLTGEPLEFPAGQGYAEGSSWSRGQAWSVYGFALGYRHTGTKEYLEAAKRAAHYFIANVACTGFVSLLDFRAPEEPVCWDTSAAACAACGLLEIAQAVDENEKFLYQNSAERILEALEEKHCCWDTEKDGILQDGSVAYGKQVHVPLIYGDYFFLEGILRLLGKDFMIW